MIYNLYGIAPSVICLAVGCVFLVVGFALLLGCRPDTVLIDRFYSVVKYASSARKLISTAVFMVGVLIFIGSLISMGLMFHTNQLIEDRNVASTYGAIRVKNEAPIPPSDYSLDRTSYDFGNNVIRKCHVEDKSKTEHILLCGGVEPAHK